MQHMQSKKTLDFAAFAWLSQIQPDGDIVCELPVLKGGQAIFPCGLLIFSSIYCVYKLFSYRIFLFCISERVVLPIEK